jgi:hypothetical protein
MTVIRYAWGRLDELRQEASLTLFRQSSGFQYCQRCWRRADYRRPLHKDACIAHDSCRASNAGERRLMVYRATFCEPCTTRLRVRWNACDNCES